jgi:hypothetical protein
MLPILARSKISYAQRILNLAPPYYWKLNELSGVTAINYGTAGAGGNLTYTGATLAQMPVPGGGLAPFFDGVDDLMSSVPISDTEGTFCAYVKVYDLAQWTDGLGKVIIGFGGGGGYVYIYQLNSSLAVCFDIAPAQTTGYSTTALNWVHLAATYSQSGNVNRFFANGVQVGVDKPFKFVTVVGSARIAVHSAVNTWYWKGYLAHVAFWNVALTPAQIAKLYVGGGS